MNANKMLVQTLKVGQAVAKRELSMSAAQSQKVHPNYIKIREKYRHFQQDNGVPVHLKGGPTDKILYGLTIGLTAAGLLGCLQFYYQMAFPKKN